MKKVIIPIFIPHKGCPHDCVFCNQKRISGHIEVPSEEDIRSIIEKYMEGLEAGTEVEIAFYGGSFTGIDINQQEKYLSVARDYMESCPPHLKRAGIRLSTRPDFISPEIISLLKKYNVKTVELGVQSLDDQVLKLSSRGHSSAHVYDAVNLLREAAFKIGIQTMIGLPGDSREKALATCDKVIALKPDMVRIYPTLVIRDTPLYLMYRKGLYTPLTLEEAVELTSLLLEKYYAAGISVIRVGLQASENIKDEAAGGDVAAGPVHPAFRQLAESRMVLRMMERLIIEKKLQGRKEVRILAEKFNPSVIIGQKKSNAEYLKCKFSIGKISVTSRGACAGECFDLVL